MCNFRHNIFRHDIFALLESFWSCYYLRVTFATYCFQICVVHSLHRGPVTSEYTVSGTTYSPEGIIFDADGMQVFNFSDLGKECYFPRFLDAWGVCSSALLLANALWEIYLKIWICILAYSWFNWLWWCMGRVSASLVSAKLMPKKPLNICHISFSVFVSFRNSRCYFLCDCVNVISICSTNLLAWRYGTWGVTILTVRDSEMHVALL